MQQGSAPILGTRAQNLKLRDSMLSLFKCLCFFMMSGLLVLKMEATEGNFLMDNLSKIQAPFTYPLNIAVYPSKTKDAGVVVCMHGYGGNYETGAVISQNLPNYTIVSFDFPDANISDGRSSPVTFGSIQELLPAIFVTKQCLLAGHLNTINLYGFSAGGGAVVNMLAVLNRSDFNPQLAAVGISVEDKKMILEAIQKGFVIVDCPLKSIEEIIDFRGNSPDLAKMAKQYASNNLRPIDSLNDLKGLSLNIILNFQNPDEALSNRDDKLFAERLKAVNQTGKTIVVTSYDQGHVAYHPALWAALNEWKAEDKSFRAKKL